MKRVFKRLVFILVIVAIGRLVVGPSVGDVVVNGLEETARKECSELPTNDTPAAVDSCVRWFLGD